MTSLPVAPARGPWVRLIPATVLVVVAAMVTGFFAATNNPATEPMGGLAASYVPAEGYVEWSLATSPGTDDVRRVSEHARSTGFTEVLALPENQITHVLSTIGDDVHTTQFWRETMHILDGVDAGQVTDLYTLTDEGVSLVAGYGGDLGWVYNPPLLQLPADVAPGASWAASGDAMPFGLATYTHSAHATTPGDAVLLTHAERQGHDVSACIQIDSVTNLFDEAGAAVLEIEQAELWCAGMGRVAAVADLSGDDVQYGPIAPSPNVAGVATSTHRAAWVDPASWVKRSATLTVDDAFFGARPFSIGLAETPRATASGLIIAVNTNTDDIVAMTPTGSTLTRAWFAHPGGDLVTVATVGDVTIASTGIRQLVAYDAGGNRLWQHKTPELVVAPPTGTGDGRIVSVGLDGTVTMFDAVTGVVDWTRALSADVDQSAVVASGTVVVIDRSGTITALNSATGDVAWAVESERASALRAIGSSVIIVGTDGWMRAFAAADGTESHSWRFPGSWRALLAAGENAVLATDEVTFGVDLTTGDELWRGDGVDAAVGDGESIIVFRGTSAINLDSTGSVVAAWEVPASYLWSSRFVVPMGNSIVLVHSGSEATIVGAR